jgi:hypothetical protein
MELHGKLSLLFRWCNVTDRLTDGCVLHVTILVSENETAVHLVNSGKDSVIINL